MPELPTVKVKYKDSDHEAIINVEDFDENLHEKVAKERPKLKKGEEKKEEGEKKSAKE